jgi:hypothetical protein
VVVKAGVTVYPRKQALALEGPPTALPQLVAVKLTVLQCAPKGHRVPSSQFGGLPHGQHGSGCCGVLRGVVPCVPIVGERACDDAGHLLVQLLTNELLNDGLEVGHPARVPETGRLMLMHICSSGAGVGAPS